MVLEARAEIYRLLDAGKIDQANAEQLLLDATAKNDTYSTHLDAIRVQCDADVIRFSDDQIPDSKEDLKAFYKFIDERSEYNLKLLGLKAHTVVTEIPSIPTFNNPELDTETDSESGVFNVENEAKIKVFKERAEGDDSRLPPTLLTILTIDRGHGPRLIRPMGNDMSWARYPYALSIDIDPLSSGFGNSTERSTIQDAHDKNLYHISGPAYRERERLDINLQQGIIVAREYVELLEQHMLQVPSPAAA